MVDLLSCPFCGCTDVSNKDDGHVEWFECDWCGATSGYDPAPEFEDKEAEWHWNRRARPSPTGEKVEAVPVAWRYEKLDRKPKGGVAWIVLLSDRCPGASSDVRNVTPLYSAATIAALVAERDEARETLRSSMAIAGKTIDQAENQWKQWEARATAAESALATANARVAELEKVLEDLLSWFPDEPSKPEWRLEAGKYGADEAVTAARATLTGGEDDR